MWGRCTMRYKEFLTIVIVVVLIVVGYLIFKSNIKNENGKFESDTTAEGVRDNSDLNPDVKESSSTFKNDKNKRAETLHRPENIDAVSWGVMIEKHKRGIESNSPIEFFGKVVDQNNEGVSGVMVRLRVLGYDESWIHNIEDGRSSQKIENIETSTGLDGGFLLKGYKGHKLIIIAFEKDGYISPQRFDKTFHFSTKLYPASFNQRTEKPVVFKMWKKTPVKVSSDLEGKRIINKKRSLNITIMADGEPTFVNLVKNKKVAPNGEEYDLAIAINREQNTKRRYGWGFTIKAYRGGVMETDALYMFKAPESGYQDIY